MADEKETPPAPVLVDGVPATVAQLERRIAGLEKSLASSEGEARLSARLESEIKALETRLTAAKAKAEAPARRAAGWLSGLDGLGNLF